MSMRPKLAAYLRQRAELGDREIILDAVDREGAVEALRAGSAAAPRRAQHDEPLQPARVPAQAFSEPPLARQHEGRSELLAPSHDIPKSTGEPVSSGAMDLKKGLVVGNQDRELFGGAIAQLNSLQEIADTVVKCTRCPLYKTALNGVPGEGNPQAKLVCVGEAPGATEDETGRPFVGAAGQLLTKILASVDLAREDVFICNVLKHRPPGNRNPLPNEVEACSPYLIRQLEVIRPRVILALGTFAAQTLLETKTPISKLRGLVHRYHGTPLIVTYHPAALLRNPAWKRPTWEDVKLARKVLDSAP
jgi:uracil-DNA glycosylase